MTTGLIALIVLALTVVAMAVGARSYLRAAISGAVLAMVATAMAAIIYIAIDYRELSLGAIVFSPLFESAVVGALAAAGFRLVNTRVRGALFIALATVCGCLLGFLVGALFVGHSPHFSHDKAVIVLASSWLVVSLVTASTYVLSPNTSLERTREG
jgi:hypothetical protein